MFYFLLFPFILDSSGDSKVSRLLSVLSSQENAAAILLPTLLLLLFSIIKYFIAVAASEIDWHDFFSEMAIDLLSIFSAFIIGRYVVVGSSSETLIMALIMFFLLMISALILSYLRRKMKSLLSRSSDASLCRVLSIIIGEYVVDIVCLVLIVVLF